KFNPLKENFTRYQNDLFKPFSIINNDVLSICEDKTGLIWLGTYGGISKFSQTLNKFSYYKVNKNNPAKGLSSSNIITSFIDEKDNVWVGTDNGLDEVINKTGEIIHYHNEPKNKNSLNNNEVRSLLVDHTGIVWIGTNGGGLNRYDPATGNFSSFKYNASDTNSISNNGVNSLFEDYKGNLWVGTWNGLNYFDHNKGKFIRYISRSNNGNSIWALHEDSKRMLWVGTDGGGVRCFNPETGNFKDFVYDSSNVNSISSNKIVSICETHDGIIWFGTSNGLSSYNKQTAEFKNYNMNDGLLSLFINGIIEDEMGFLWISTDKGLSKFDRKQGSFSNFTERNGLKDIDFLARVVCKSSNNILYFGAKHSLVFFNPNNINDELVPVPVVFTDLKFFNQPVPVSSDGSTILNRSITSAKSIEIPSYDDVITLDFALLDYYNIKAHNFKYKLSGFDNRWNEVGTRNSATYTNLPPGDYTFYVKAINNNDKRSEKAASIKIIIVPSFYQTLWFKIFSGFLLIFLIAVVYKIRIRTINKRNKMLADLLKEKENLLSEKIKLLGEKEALLKEIHHRVKNNLQIISSLLYLNSKNIKDTEALNMFKDSQSRVKSIALVHERLYRSADLSKINFKEYVNHLTTDLFRSYAVNQSVIKLAIDINNIFIDIDLAIPCGLIINELISNSLKYAFSNYEAENKTGLIKICFNQDGSGKLVLLISDNGVGMPEGFAEKKRLSLGLQLVDTLVSQLEGTLEIEPGQGTSYKIMFEQR
ncbi:MAG TPA: two-component regulator propeller domain-containing protein, partial [Ignavibacteriaceae bacterium]|nr:two-component regulator propeller domain-containing protein [Ignavibacteriaceae bacterium]